MKKSIVVLFIVLALVVIVSPGIVGKLAENSMDENLDWAATETQDIAVSSQGFERGWFSSEGEHRVELLGGEGLELFLALAEVDDPDALPAIVINTRLDHGIIPVSSMSREQGSLMPGLGSAVSTLRLDLGGGKSFDVPGTIYSKVGLTGSLRSNYVLGPGSFSDEDGTASWGSADFVLTTNASSGSLGIAGELSSFDLDAHGDAISIERLVVDIDQRPGPFGYSVGRMNVSVASMFVDTETEKVSLGPLQLESDSSIDGDRVNANTRLNLDNVPVPGMGSAGLAARLQLLGADGASLGGIRRTVASMDQLAPGQDAYSALEADLQRLLAGGFELQVEQLDFKLPQGLVESRMQFLLGETELSGFTWTAPLLALEATADVRLPGELVDMLVAVQPQMQAAVGMGFLRKDGDTYTLAAEYKQGLLTVNGAPIPLPLP